MWNQMPLTGMQQFPLLKQSMATEASTHLQGDILGFGRRQNIILIPHSLSSLGTTCTALTVLAAATEMASFLILSQP